MTPSVSLQADRELIEGGVFYARDGGRELGIAFVDAFERAVNFLSASVHGGALTK